jgi:hypothetical protein
VPILVYLISDRVGGARVGDGEKLEISNVAFDGGAPRVGTYRRLIGVFWVTWQGMPELPELPLSAASR